MFIIMSCPRSGSTLLVQCLHAHGDIAVIDETDIVVPMAFVLSRVHDPEAGREIISNLIPATTRFDLTLREHFTVDEIRDLVHSAEYSLTGILDSIFRALAKKQNKKAAGYKYPDDLQYTGMLSSAGLYSSDIKIIHLVRDVRDVVASLKRLGWLEDPVGYIKPWSVMNLALHRRLKDQPAGYMLLRYEDLVGTPEKKLSEVCGFLGVDFRREMLLPSRREDRHKGFEHCENVYKEISTNAVGRHKKDMAPELTAECETRAKEAMETFGYTRVQTGGSRVGGLFRKLFR